VGSVVASISTDCRRREEDVAALTKSGSTTADVDSGTIVAAKVLGSTTKYVDVVTLANGPAVGIVGGIVVLEAVLFGALPEPVNPMPGLGG
jgi:hypothetical protein